MKKLLKKFLYSGIGFVSLTADKLKTTVDKLIEEGKVSSEEGKKIIDDFVEKTKTKKDEFDNHFETIGENALKNAKLAKHKDLDDLTKRLEELEKKMDKKDSEAHED